MSSETESSEAESSEAESSEAESSHEGLEFATAAQILDGLQQIARVEHALCVEYLTIYCALGRGLFPADGAAIIGPADQAASVRAAAETVFGMALAEMSHLRRVNAVLTLAGRPPELGRAAVVAGDSGPIQFDPLGQTQLESFLDREEAIAAAVEALYARLHRAVASPAAPVDGELLAEITFVLEASQMTTPPQGGVDTGAGSTSGFENAGLVGAGGLALLGGAALLARRRVATNR